MTLVNVERYDGITGEIPEAGLESTFARISHEGASYLMNSEGCAYRILRSDPGANTALAAEVRSSSKLSALRGRQSEAEGILAGAVF